MRKAEFAAGLVGRARADLWAVLWDRAPAARKIVSHAWLEQFVADN